MEQRYGAHNLLDVLPDTRSYYVAQFWGGSTMDVYVINLDKDVERRHWMDRQLTAHKVTYLRVAAVNGAELRARQHPYSVDPRRSHLGAAEVGCILSHTNAWRLITQADDEHGFVLEDDVHVSDDFGDFIRSVRLNPSELCVHKVETGCANVTLIRQPSYSAQNRKAYKLQTNHAGAGAYILNKRTASHLLEHVDLFHAAIDTELFDPDRRTVSDITIYQWVPAPCIQDCFVRPSEIKMSFPSNIGIDRADRRLYPVRSSQQYEHLVKSQLRPLYTKLYSAVLFRSGRMRTSVEFR
jgi:glycosyl transferase, family 25